MNYTCIPILPGPPSGQEQPQPLDPTPSISPTINSISTWISEAAHEAAASITQSVVVMKYVAQPGHRDRWMLDKFDRLHNGYAQLESKPPIPRLTGRLENLAEQCMTFSWMAKLSDLYFNAVIRARPRGIARARAQDPVQFQDMAAQARGVVVDFQNARGWAEKTITQRIRPFKVFGPVSRKAPPTFHLFMQLPKELRLTIWELASQPPHCAHLYLSLYGEAHIANPWVPCPSPVERVRSVRYNRCALFMPDAGMWRANKESRGVMITEYNRWAHFMATAVRVPGRIRCRPIKEDDDDDDMAERVGARRWTHDPRCIHPCNDSDWRQWVWKDIYAYDEIHLAKYFIGSYHFFESPRTARQELYLVRSHVVTHDNIIDMDIVRVSMSPVDDLEAFWRVVGRVNKGVSWLKFAGNNIDRWLFGGPVGDLGTRERRAFEEMVEDFNRL